MEFQDATGRMFRTEDINLNLERMLPKMSEMMSSNEVAAAFTPNQPTATRTVETLDHVPALAPRARGASKGGAFSDAIAAFKALPAGAKGIAVAVDPDKVVKLGGMPKVQAALRTAFKRSGGIAGSSFSVSPTADGRIWVGKL